MKPRLSNPLAARIFTGKFAIALSASVLFLLACQEEAPDEGVCRAICEFPVSQDQIDDCVAQYGEIDSCYLDQEETCFMATEDDCPSLLEQWCEQNEDKPGGSLVDLENTLAFLPDCESCDDECASFVQLWAPNIYLYPEVATNVEVTLISANGSELLFTRPEYGDGWNVWVEPGGLIDGEYDYLYYEAVVDLLFQDNEGWAIEQEGVFDFFEETMANYGFVEHEIEDFLDYWHVHLPNASCYLVYPQLDEQIVQMFEVAINPAPDSLDRLWFVVDPVDDCINLPAPSVVPFERRGFAVVEWGVVLR